MDEHDDQLSGAVVPEETSSRDGDGRPDLFISYSRTDAAFVRRLELALRERAKDAWVDYGEIRRSEDWWSAITVGIDASRTFVAVLTPELVESEVCGDELAHALSSNKRIVPILRREIDRTAANEALTRPDWIFFREADGFDQALGELVQALETDLEWLDEHARLLVRAKEWEQRGRDRSRLLRGSDLVDAERWLSRQGSHREPATALQADYIVAGRGAASRRQRLGLAAIAGALAASISLTVIALTQRNHAIEATRSATSLALASTAGEQLPRHLDVALLLSLEAYRTRSTTQAATSVISALEAARPEGTTQILHGFTGPVLQIAFSPDGRTVATASFAAAETTRLWNIRTRTQLGEALPALPPGLHSLVFSPDGRVLAGAGNDESITLLDVRTHRLVGRPLRRAGATGRGYIHDLAFSPDGHRIASAGGDGVQLWDAGTHARLGQPLGGKWGTVAAVAFSPNGELLAGAGNDGIVRLWTIPTRRELGQIGPDSGALADVAFSPDGRTLASANVFGRVRLWDVTTLGGRGRPLYASASPLLAFSPDGRTLAAAGGDGAVRLWDVDTQKQLGRSLLGLTAPAGVAFSRAGATLMAGGADGTVWIWNVRTVTDSGRLLDGHQSSVLEVAFSPDGRTLAALGFGGTVRLWDMRTDTMLGRPLGRNLEAFAFSPDGRTLATAGADRRVRFWDTRTGTPRGSSLHGHNGGVHALAFSLDGRTLASGTDNGVQLWDMRTRAPVGRTLRFPGPAVRYVSSPDVLALAVSPDRRTLASAGSDGSVWLWDMRTHAQIGKRLDTSQGSIDGLAFSPDGRTLASIGAATVQLWDVRTRAGRGSFPLGAPNSPTGAAAFGAGGRMLAGADPDEVTVRIWDVRTRTLLGRPLASRTGHVAAVAVSPDGHTLAAAGDNGKVRIWQGILWGDLADLNANVCGFLHGNLTKAEWSELVPGLAYRTTCPG